MPRAAPRALAIVATVALVTAGRAGAQPSGGDGARVGMGAVAGGIRFDADFAGGADAAWAPLLGGRIGLHPTPQAGFVVEVWRAVLDAPERVEGDLGVWAAAAHLELTPWTGRGWPVDPVFGFGLETIRADDDEDRGVSFVSGLGVRRILARRLEVRVQVRNHLMTIEEGAVDDVETGRDATLWEARVGIVVVPGGAR